MVYTLATTTSEEVDERLSAAPMSSERAAKPLQNFSLPWDLKWGSQRHLRCMKVDDDSSDAGVGSAARIDRRRSENTTARRREIVGGFERRTRPARRPRIDVVGGDSVVEMEVEEEGIEAMREKLMFEFKTAADKMKDAILRGGEGTAASVVAPAPVRFSPEEADVAEEDDDMEEEEGEIVAVAAAEEGGGGSPAAAVRPWNLRTRRAACKAPIKGLRIEEMKVNSLPLRSEGGAKSPRLVRAAAAASGSGVEKERPKFSVTLSKNEIDEDFMKMLGHRAPRRPKKRPRAVQKLLEGVFPATWLTEVSADSYKVPEFPETVKR